MNRIQYLAFTLLVLLSGCGKKLVGRYEATPEVPQMRMPGVNAAFQQQMAAQIEKAQALNRMTLEFDGSKVRFGRAGLISEFSYQISGNKLEVTSDAMGQKTILPMTLEEDGSITYLSMHFHKVE